MAHAPQAKVVLVVEDNPVLLIHSIELIRAAGFDVIQAHDADEAIELLVQHDDISIVFTDIEMPGSMDGLKLARAIRGRWPPVHLILASGRYSPVKDEMPEGSKFFAKPFDDTQLVAALHEFAALEQIEHPSANA